MTVSGALALSAPKGVPCGAGVRDFREIYDTHVAFVFRTLRRFGVPPAALDDAVQDVFTVVHTKLDTFEERSSLKTWIFGIARRVAAKHRDRRKEKPAEGDIELQLDARTSQRPDTERVDKARLLYRLLDQLTPELREIFLLVELEQMSMREAAEALDENQNTLASRHKKAKRQLQEALTRIETFDAWRRTCKI